MSKLNQGQEKVRDQLMRIMSAKSDLIDGMDFHTHDLTREQNAAVLKAMTALTKASEDIVTAWTSLSPERS